MNLFQKRIFNLVFFSICIVCFSQTVSAQSTDLNFPTAVTTNQINGTIKARDIGDSRLTSYFFTFDGGQGDIFINAVTKNFNGDIDVFLADGLRPLTKMVIYTDVAENETGRLVYLRRPERLILRVEGRSPNDDPATFRIKFAGSFVAAAEQRRQEDPSVARQETDPVSGVRVNSVGTIVGIIPKPEPSGKGKPDVRENGTAANDNARDTKSSRKGSDNSPAAPPERIAIAPTAKTPKRTVLKPKPEGTKPASASPAPKPSATSEIVAKKVPDSKTKPIKSDTRDVKTVFKQSSNARNETAAQSRSNAKSKAIAPAEKTSYPMAGIHLVVQLKDGDVIERPMTEIKKFSVDKGVLTVIANDGSTVRYSIFDVAKVTIE